MPCAPLSPSGKKRTQEVRFLQVRECLTIVKGDAEPRKGARACIIQCKHKRSKGHPESSWYRTDKMHVQRLTTPSLNAGTYYEAVSSAPVAYGLNVGAWEVCITISDALRTAFIAAGVLKFV